MTTTSGMISTSQIELRLWKRRHHFLSATQKLTLDSPKQTSLKRRGQHTSASIFQEEPAQRESTAGSTTEFLRRKIWTKPMKTILGMSLEEHGMQPTKRTTQVLVRSTRSVEQSWSLTFKCLQTRSHPWETWSAWSMNSSLYGVKLKTFTLTVINA